MPRLHLILFVVTSMALSCASAAQVAPTTATASATCNYDDDHQLVVNYQRVTFNLKKVVLGREIPYGKVWAPGGKPLTLLTNTAFEIGGKTVPMGGYTMFIIPNPKQWTLVVSKSTDMSGKYDEQQDIVRVPMESGELPSPEPELSIGFAHIGPDECSIRLELEKTGNFVTFRKR